MTSTAGQYCFTHPNGGEVYLFTLRNARGTEVFISNYGAIITSFKIKNVEGEMNDIVLGFDKVEDYLAEDYLKHYPWFGAAVGRYANRIKNAAVEIDGINYRLSKNNNNNQLHGGHVGFDKKVWQFLAQGEAPHQWLKLKYDSPDGEEGFPGNLEVIIRFELNNENELSYEYKATSDQSTAVNLTHHSYFNLNNGVGTINDDELKIYSSTILEQDMELIPTGKKVAVENSLYDFRNFKKISNNSSKSGEYDQSFVVDKQEDSIVAELRSPASGFILQVYSSEPTVHFYSGKWVPRIKGKKEILYGPFSGLCLETQTHSNAINIPEFPNTVLRPGETYHQKTVYKIIT